MSSNLPGPGESLGAFGDKLTIETPEQTSLDFAIAGIGSRFLALAIDTLIQIAVGLVALFGGSMLVALLAAAAPKASLWGFALLFLFLFFIYFGYYALFEIIWNGQTPGKRHAGIRVIKDSGRPLTPAESIGRNLMRIVDWMPGFYAVGIVSALLTKENKRLGDLIAGSIVVRESALSDLKPVWETAQTPAAAPSTLYGADRLSPEDYTLIDSFLNRRSSLDANVRYRMSEEIFRRIQSKVVIPEGNTRSIESIFEALVYERRASGGCSS